MTTQKQLGLVALLAVLSISSPFAQAADYVVDTKGGHAAIAFKFKHLGLSWLTGEFKDFDGRFSFDAANPARSEVAVNIRTASIDSNHAERDKHMRSKKFLHTDKFPSARFVSKRIEDKGNGAMAVVGDMTLHGVTKEIAIDARVVGIGADPWGGYRAGFEGETTLDTTDFGMEFPPGNTVYMQLYLEGIRQ